MAPLFVALSIFIKGLPLVYPGRGLMAGTGGGGDHAVTFTVLKKAYCCPAPKGPGLKGFLRTPRAKLFSSDKRSCEVLTGHSYPYL